MEEVAMVAIFALAALVQAGLAEPSIPPDSVEALWRDARRAQSNYERLARALAPVTYRGSRGGSCDERVGRFCINFSPRGDRPDLPEESPRVATARQDVVASFRRLVSVVPGDSAAVTQLIRYLVEDGRAGEAIPIARTFAWASENPVWSSFLQGFANQAAGEDAAAEDDFTRALTALPPELRREFESIEHLLTGEDRSAYRRMDDVQRAEYESAVWRVADPLLLTPANEAWTDHMARHVWIQMLARSPRVNGTVAWGSDLEQLTLRYGVPVSRERIPATHVWDTEIQMLERYSPDQLWFVPDQLRTRGLPSQPDPGEPWHLDEPAARSGHTPPAFRLVDLPHQVTRFPQGDSVLIRMDGLVPVDATVSDRATIATGLFVLSNATYQTIHREVRDTTGAAGDSLVVTRWVKLPAGEYAYSMEALEAESGTGARARYPITLARASPNHVALSDILVARPFPEERLPEGRADPAILARPRLIVEPDEAIGIFAEIHALRETGSGLARYSVELALEPDRRGNPVIRWFGRLLGAGGDAAPGVRWTAEASGDEPVVVALNLGLEGLDPGFYTVRLTVRDLVAGESAERTRRLRIGEPT